MIHAEGIPQRMVVVLLDGLGIDYLEQGPMPNLQAMRSSGFYCQVRAVVPTVTNVNNVSVCCGAWPEEHGISANSYYDEASRLPVYMNSSDLIRVDTVIQWANKMGVKGALLTAKRKSMELFHCDAAIAVAAEAPSPEFVERYGAPPDIYSSEINHWLWKVAIDLLKNNPEIGVIYLHTTDYPMHRWSPEEEESRQHLSKMDELIGEARSVAPDAAFFITADHGMNAKKRCWDLSRICAERGTPVQFTLSPERDYYMVHHRNFAGSGWVWLNTESDEEAVRNICMSLEGVEEVIDRAEAEVRFHLPGEYIGDLMVLGDRDTVFGDLETSREELTGDYRAHGSLYEADVPLIIHGWNEKLPPAETFTHNLHLTRFLFYTGGVQL
jgi:phosphonoacetate hydrolase